jgi:DNA-binding PadR family transcriptional regulator
MTNLGYALLGMLADQSRTGYDLAQLMKQQVGYFWSAKHSQIYPELARLESEGLVAFEVIEQQDRPHKKLYHITPAGLEILRNWVTTPAESTPVRDELILKAYCIWLAEPEKAIELFKQEELRHRQQLAQYEQLYIWGEENLQKEQRSKRSSLFGKYLSLARGISHEREYAEWCRWVIEQLEKPDFF